MSLAVEIFAPMPTRPCAFCLSLQGGSVFADFDTDAAEIVSFRRISFDGYGCCNLEASTIAMTPEDSRLLLDAIAGRTLGSAQVEQALRNFFRQHKAALWSDALAEHELL